MTSSSSIPDPHSEAAAWFVRLHEPVVAEADWQAFTLWLEAAPVNREVYDAIDLLWADLDAARPEAQPGAPVPPPVLEPVSGVVLPMRPRARTPAIWRGAALAAGLAAAVVLAAIMVGKAGPKAQTWATGPGDTRTVVLPDGSRVDLGRSTRFTSRFAAGSRDVALESGEAAFDVTPDASRPFIIATGDRRIRVVGTAFDVVRRDGRLSIVVRRGVVSVEPTGGAAGSPVRLTVGGRLSHGEGSADQQVSHVYRARPLAEVAADLSRDLPVPIRVDPAIAALPFTGVLQLDNEAAVITQLTTFLPVEADSHSGSAEIRLKPRHGPKHAVTR